MVIERSQIVGRWDIIDWVQRYDDGRVVHPLGTAPIGFVRYAADGEMVVILSADQRAPFTGGQWTASAAAKAEAYDSYLSYAGTFTVHGDEIRHTVPIALCPNWVGTVQKRKVVLAGDELQLVARLEAGTPEARTATLRWRRAIAGA